MVCIVVSSLIRSQEAMKLVHKPDMVAHLWANQSQAEARNAGGTFYFHGDTIYSYGGHFPIARHAMHKGKHAILFTTRSYSVTTSSHISMVRHAIKRDSNVFHVPLTGLVTCHADNLKYFAESIKEALAAPTKARKWKIAEYKRQANSYARQGNEYAAFFGLKTKFKAVEITGQESWLLCCVRLRERLPQWLAGENVHLPDCGSQVYLRIKEDIVQTSKGAEVPLEHALKLLPIIRSGKAWHRNGQEIRIGSFFMDSIDEQGNIKAGCHTITRQEMERLAATIGK